MPLTVNMHLITRVYSTSPVGIILLSATVTTSTSTATSSTNSPGEINKYSNHIYLFSYVHVINCDFMKYDFDD